jgi:hypothetical protein
MGHEQGVTIVKEHDKKKFVSNVFEISSPFPSNGKI